jgi:hypothetical protein
VGGEALRSATQIWSTHVPQFTTNHTVTIISTFLKVSFETIEPQTRLCINRSYHCSRGYEYRVKELLRKRKCAIMLKSCADIVGFTPRPCTLPIELSNASRHSQPDIVRNDGRRLINPFDSCHVRIVVVAVQHVSGDRKRLYRDEGVAS